MKYIRTKEGVYDLDKYLIENATKKCFRGVITGVDSKEDIEIIKQADTIKELCDEFVIKVKEGGYLLLNNYEKALSLHEEATQIGAIIYGAIWTDKGLIYVAKMNDKGELELL